MLYAMIHNNQTAQPEEFSFPASQWDMIDATARRNASPLQEPYAALPPSVPGCEHLQEALKTIDGSDEYLYELSALDAQLETKNPDELKTIDVLVAIYKPESIGALYQLTENLDQVMVASNIHSSEELGKFLVNEELVEIPENALSYVDFQKVGEQHLAEHNAVIVNGMYYEDPVQRDMEISQIALQTDDVCWEGPMFQVNIESDQSSPASKPVLVTLPASDEELSRILETTDQTQTLSVQCAIDSLYLSTPTIRAEFRDITPLNDLATTLSMMDQAEYVKFMAVLEHEDLLAPSQPHYHDRINQMREVAGELDSYHLETTITTASEYAAELLTTAGLEELIPHMDLESYGEDKLIGIGGREGSYGIVSTQPLELSHSEQPEFTQTM